jgi:tetratricopeptide (TPR) repeat protein
MRKIIQNGVLIILGFILFFVLVECLLQVTSFAMTTLKDMRNQAAIKNKGDYVILCLGESTTDGQWPPFLEEYLERSGIGIDFTVIDKGRMSTNTTEIFNSLAQYLEEYSPDMVITMMGINDPLGEYATVRELPQQPAPYPLKTIKLFHLIYLHLREYVLPHKEADAAEDVEARVDQDETIKALKEKIARDRYYSKAYLDLAEIYLERGAINQAEEIMLKALSVNPREVETNIAVAEFYSRLNNREKMHNYFEKACAIRPRVRPYAAYAVALMNNEEYKNAYDILDSAPSFIKEDPQIFGLQLTCLLAANDLSSLRETIDSFDMIVAQKGGENKELADSYRQAGLVFYKGKKYQDALFVFKRATELDPRNHQAYLDLCRAYKVLGDLDKAEDAIQRSLSIKETGAAYADYADIHFARGHYMKALDLLLPVELKMPNNVDVYFALSFTYLHLYEIDILTERLYRSAELFTKENLSEPKRIELFTACVSHLLKSGQIASAEKLLQVVTSIAPSLYDVHLLRAECYKAQEKYDEALVILQKMLDEEPRERTFLKLHETLYLQERKEEAIAVLTEGISIFPASLLLYAALGEAYLEYGEIEKAQEIFHVALSLEPENKEILRTLAINFPEGALGKTALEYFSERYDPQGTLQPEQELKDLILGDVFLARKEFISAERAYQEALFRPVDIDSTYAGLSMSYLRQEKIEEAEHYFSLLNEYREKNHPKNVAFNYRDLARMLAERGIPLVAVQYPMRTVSQLKNMLQGFDDVIFVDNEMLFKERVYDEGYEIYFQDTFANDFGHCTQKGNKLLAKNIADVILREVFHYSAE